MGTISRNCSATSPNNMNGNLAKSCFWLAPLNFTVACAQGVWHPKNALYIDMFLVALFYSPVRYSSMLESFYCAESCCLHMCVRCYFLKESFV